MERWVLIALMSKREKELSEIQRVYRMGWNAAIEAAAELADAVYPAAHPEKASTWLHPRENVAAAIRKLKKP